MYGRRLQILLDDERYECVAGAARERHVSVATVIREAIDRSVPSPAERRRAALLRILDAPDMEVPDDWAELHREIDEGRTHVRPDGKGVAGLLGG